MGKPFDYYAGYPGQQATPKWLGVVLGGVFGSLLLVTLAVGIRLVMPARTAQASVAPALTPAALPVVAVAAAEPVAEDASIAPASQKAHRSHGHKAKTRQGGHAVAAATPKYKKAQLFAKSVSRKDKKARDDLDRMLGL